MIKRFFSKKKKEIKSFKEVSEWAGEIEGSVQRLSKGLEELKKESKFSIKKVGIVRFNPFKDVGGNQSFSVALLNEEDTGIVITSLYCREESKVYGKPIKEGKSEHQLSKEEEEAIKKAKDYSKE